MDSRKSIEGESLRESLYSCTCISMYCISFRRICLDSPKICWWRIFAGIDSRILAEFLALLLLVSLMWHLQWHGIECKNLKNDTALFCLFCNWHFKENN